MPRHLGILTTSRESGGRDSDSLFSSHNLLFNNSIGGFCFSYICVQYECVCIHVFERVHTCVCAHVCSSVCTPVCAHVCVSVCTHTCVSRPRESSLVYLPIFIEGLSFEHRVQEHRLA